MLAHKKEHVIFLSVAEKWMCQLHARAKSRLLFELHDQGGRQRVAGVSTTTPIFKNLFYKNVQKIRGKMQSRATWLFLIRFLLTAIKSKCMYSYTIIIKKRKLELSIFIKLFPPPTNMNRVLLINNRSKLSLIKSRLMHRRRAAKNTTTTELNQTFTSIY